MSISIITVCYNSGKSIERCLKSIVQLEYTNVEFIAIDGASSDNTLEILSKYEIIMEKKGIKTKIISEKDSGLYYAMNKGIDYASGKWIIFMNSDDEFYEPTALNFLNSKDYDDYDVIYGNTIIRLENGEKIKQKARALSKLLSGYEMPFCHQSTFVKKSILEEYKFNTDYRIIADIDSFIRMYIDKKKFYHINEYIAIFSNEGISQTKRIDSILEGISCLKRHNLLTIRKKIILMEFLIWYRIKPYAPAKYAKFIKDFFKWAFFSIWGL